jgi:PAB-dependent poly(A)-specific ribonuclease subunit 3
MRSRSESDLWNRRSGMDLLEGEMISELENARLVRLLTKFGFINERPECVLVVI